MENNIPTTLDEAVAILVDALSEEEKKEIRSSVTATSTAYDHMSVGMEIRNAWGLWYNKTPLSKWFTTIDINHGDDRSGIIIETAYRTILGQPIDLEGQIQKYKNHWLKAGFKDGIHPVINN